MKLFGVLALIFVGSLTHAQTILIINCNFRVIRDIYACEIDGATIPDDSSLEIQFSGNHLSDLNNAYVELVTVFGSDIPYVLPQFFTTFSNLRQLFMTRSGLKRIQAGGFNNAASLRELRILESPLTSIEANAFVGASNIEKIYIFNNAQLEKIDEGVFNSLTTLKVLDLADNNLNYIAFNAFQSLSELELLYLSDNSLTSLDGRLLANNQKMNVFNISRNKINAIGSNLLSSTSRITSFRASRNICIDAEFIVDGTTTTIANIHEALKTCYENTF